MNRDNKTFAQVAESALTALVLQEAAQSERIDVVFDVYCQTSIKDAERVTWGVNTTPSFAYATHIGPDT